MSDNEHRPEYLWENDPTWKASWRRPISQILYGLLTHRDLGDPYPAKMAEAMVERRYFGDGPAVYAEAIAQALAHEGPITRAIETSHSEQAIRDFLARVAVELTALQPWRPAPDPGSRPRSLGRAVADEADEDRQNGR